MADIGADSAAPTVERAPITIGWTSIFSGAVCGAGLAFVLDAFGAAIGLAVSSAAPTWRDASFSLTFLSGLYLILTALVSYGFGAYIASRMRSDIADTAEEREVRDGVRGLVVWGVMTLFTALILMIGSSGLTQISAASGGTSGATASVPGEGIIAFDLDRLFRTANRSAATPNTYLRSEAARILLTTSSHRGLLADDRAYLVTLVEKVTGLTSAEAQTRVGTVVASAKQNIDRARNSGVILAFMVAAAALIGAIASWFAAGAGGRQRDGIDNVWPEVEWRAPSVRF
jgi:hypothetical protein